MRTMKYLLVSIVCLIALPVLVYAEDQNAGETLGDKIPFAGKPVKEVTKGVISGGKTLVDEGKKLTGKTIADSPAETATEKMLDNIPGIGSALGEVEKGVEKGAKELGQDVFDTAKKTKSLFFDPIIVSATRLPSVSARLSTLPANATVITSEDIKRSGAETVQEALQYIDGVNIFDQVGNGVDSSLNLRGFTNSEELAVIVDGVRVNETDLNIFNPNLIHIDSIEKIEVVRGSSSAVFGDSVFGGVLNITTKQPSEKLISPFGSYEVGSFRYQNLTAGVSGTVDDAYMLGIPGKAKYYFSAARRLNGGYRDNGDTRGTFFDGKLGYELEDESGEVMLYIKYSDQENHNPGELTLNQLANNRQQSVKPLDNRKWENLILSLNANKQLFDEHIDLSFNAYRRLLDVDFISTSVVFGQTKEFTTLSTQKGLTAQLTYNETFRDIDNALTFGIEYSNGSDNDESVILAGGAGTTDNSTDKDDTGFFVQDIVTLFDKLIVTTSLRHDEVDYRFDDHTNAANTRTSSFDETTARVGGVLKVIDNVDVFASFSEAFKAPGKSDLFDTTGWGGNDPTLKPETADSYEIGTRLRWKNLASANVTLFHITTDDEIFFDAISFTSANIGKTRRYGLETSINVRPCNVLDGYFTYTFTDAKVRATRSGFANPVDSGRELGLVPENRFTAGVHVGPFKGVNVWLNSLFVGRQHTQSAETLGGNLDPIEPYYVFNGKASYTYKGAEIYCKVNNILDREYVTRGIYSGGNYYVTPAPEREIIGGIRFEF